MRDAHPLRNLFTEEACGLIFVIFFFLNHKNQLIVSNLYIIEVLFPPWPGLQSNISSGLKSSYRSASKNNFFLLILTYRNYHVFYYLLLGVSEEERREFQLKQPEDYFYLNQVNSLKPQPQTWPLFPTGCLRSARGSEAVRLGHLQPPNQLQVGPERGSIKEPIHSLPPQPCPMVPAKIILTHHPPQPRSTQSPADFVFQHNLKIEDGEDLKHDFERLKQAMEMVGFLPATKKQ